LQENGEKEKLQSLYKVEVRNNNVLRRRRGCEFGVNLVENVEATSRNITIPVTQLDFLQYAGRKRDRGSSKGAVDKAGSERTCKFPRSKKPKPEFRD